MDGQFERTIRTFKDLSRAYVLEFEKNWEDHLPLVKFTYNSSYQTTMEMTPYEALCGQWCRIPICWEEVGDKMIMGSEMVKIAFEKVRIIKNRMKTA